MADATDPADTADPAPAERPTLILTGATATGKSALALAVAQRLEGEIISADSRQVYRDMDIGTAKVTPEERARVPHHGLDLIDPDQRYSAGRFARDARTWAREIRERGRVPVIVGGTGFFVRALTKPMFREPEMDPECREVLRRHLRRMESRELRRWLARLDSESAAALRNRGGTQRIERALEVALLTGHTLPWWQRERPPEHEPLDAIIFLLELPRDRLYDRINHRVDAMLDAGLVDEVADLLTAGYAPGDPGMSATGYAEIVGHLEGTASLDDAADAIRARTRKYARRQLTWFRNQLPDDAVRLDGTRPVDELVEEVVERWSAA